MEKIFSTYGVRKDETEINESSYKSKKEHKLSTILVSNYQFVDWLETFCINHPNFFDDDWDFYPVQINWEDYENVKRLRNFYEGILDYAKKTHHNIIDGVVFLKYGSIGFEIRPKSNSATSTLCCFRRDISGSHDFIDFNDIMYHVAH